MAFDAEAGYTDYESANQAVEAAIKDTIRDNPDLTVDVIYWDMVQAIMWDCDDATERELSQRTGVSRVRRGNDDATDWVAQLEA